MPLLGLFERRLRWGLSWKGWFALLLTIVFGAWLLAVTIYPFLAVCDRKECDTLVVEGWIPHYAISLAAEEFRSYPYKQIYTTGGPTGGFGGYTNDFNTSASVGAGELVSAGIPRDTVQPVPSRVMDRDRTYSSAVALRDWLWLHKLSPTALNIVTEAPHARRTRLLFQQALGPRTKVGIIPIANPDYNPRRWWQYSEGVRDIPGEALAYLYARLVFTPR